MKMYSSYFNPQAKASKNVLLNEGNNSRKSPNERNHKNRSTRQDQSDGFMEKVKGRMFDLLNYLLVDETAEKEWQSSR